MKNNKETICKNTDDYIALQPPANRALLLQLRETIRKAAPNAEETISYCMPAYKLNGVLVYFAGYKQHIGFYPGAEAITVFKSKLTTYTTSKGTIQFPLDKPLPLTLISKIVKYRVKVNEEKLKKKK